MVGVADDSIVEVGARMVVEGAEDGASELRVDEGCCSSEVEIGAAEEVAGSLEIVCWFVEEGMTASEVKDSMGDAEVEGEKTDVGVSEGMALRAKDKVGWGRQRTIEEVGFQFPSSLLK
jgi:hypothetical protein